MGSKLTIMAANLKEQLQLFVTPIAGYRTIPYGRGSCELAGTGYYVRGAERAWAAWLCIHILPLVLFSYLRGTRRVRQGAPVIFVCLTQLTFSPRC